MTVLVITLVACKEESKQGGIPTRADKEMAEVRSKPAAPEPVRWEYTRTFVGGVGGEEVVEKLNELGERGWEVVGFYKQKLNVQGNEKEFESALLKRRKK